MKKLRTSAKFKLYKHVRKTLSASHPKAFPQGDAVPLWRKAWGAS